MLSLSNERRARSGPEAMNTTNIIAITMGLVSAFEVVVVAVFV